MEYAEYYKKAWEHSLKERTSDLQAEINRLRKALEQIENDSAWNDPAWRIASDALKGREG